jgi:hypothetical protein
VNAKSINDIGGNAMERNSESIEKIADFMGDLDPADFRRVRYENELGVATIMVIDQWCVNLEGMTVEGWDNIEDLYEFLVGTFPNFL